METRFKNNSNEELITHINNEVGNPGWGSSRAKFLTELSHEMLNREIDFSLIMSKGSLQLSKKIILIDGKIVFDELTSNK